MTCSLIMTPRPLSVQETETIAKAAVSILEHGYINLPVVNEKNILVGLFGIYDLLALLVPRVAVVGNLMPNLRFVSDDMGDLTRKYRAIKNNPLKCAVNREAVRVHPDTPVIEAIRLFCRNHTTIPVVERETGVLVGMISYWDAARAIIEGPD